ncbi:helix-turn-helix domain-containing protein [Streptomyces echinoruber]|uniref:Transcriptional regulator n=1 Tax=Streptomyces echinoruber TaxID=68898 RepID=A0A918R097_9ACTN|nr:helix-turn-helix transcriptional regulator [Streptomyces echinoruber]GGZ81063.1 transcriptional regulator [Streptomyces echinoruber]
MPVRKPPTERQRRIGAELRRMRERAGLSINEAATLHHTDRTTVSNTESARSGVSSDRVRVWAANYSCPDAAYVDALAALAGMRGTQWWDAYRGKLAPQLVDIAEMEHHAVALRYAQITHMPGLLQHRDYMRGVFQQAVPPLTPESLDRHVEFRLRRTEVLDRDDPPRCTFLIHEAALRIWYGDRGVLRTQLAHLLKESERDNVAVRVIPFAAGGFANVGSCTVYAHGPVPQLDTVQIDVPTGVLFLHEETHLVNYRAVLDRIEERALDPERSRDFIRAVAQDV